MTGGLLWLIQKWKLNFYCFLNLRKCKITSADYILIKGIHKTTTLIKLEVKNLTID